MKKFGIGVLYPYIIFKKLKETLNGERREMKKFLVTIFVIFIIIMIIPKQKRNIVPDLKEEVKTETSSLWEVKTQYRKCNISKGDYIITKGWVVYSPVPWCENKQKIMLAVKKSGDGPFTSGNPVCFVCVNSTEIQKVMSWWGYNKKYPYATVKGKFSIEKDDGFCFDFNLTDATIIQEIY